jgi:tRNA (cmo5U34)-methyltransferase
MQDALFNYDTNVSLPTTEYDIIARQSIPAYDALFTMIEALLALYLANNAHILIVGAGGGNEIVTLGQAHSEWKMTGVDPSEKMLEIAQQKVDSLNLANRVTLQKGVIEEVSAYEYDAATSLLVMHFLPDDSSKLAYLQAIANRLKSGSPFLLVDFQGDKQSESFKILVAGWQKRAELAGMEQEYLTNLVDKMWQHLCCIPEKRTIELLEQANFKNVTRFYSAFVYTGWLAFAS